MMVRISYPPMSFFVMPAFGSKMRSNHQICGKNVATLNACFMFSVVKMPAAADKSREEERAAEFVIKVLAVSKSSTDRESADDCCVFL